VKLPGWAAALFLVLAGVASVSAQTRLDLETSHAGPVTDLVYDAERELLFSAGEDGSIRVWSAPRARLLAVLRVSYQPIQQITVRPGYSQVAALVSGSAKSSTVEVWDWEKSERLYSLEFREQLLFLQYSPGGSYLVATRADFDSLALLEPNTGRSLYYMRKGFGIVSFAVVSRTENNIMTYQPSGTITYWEIRTGRTLKQVRTVPNLSLFALSPNNRFLAAAYEDRLAVVDLLSGERIDERQVPGLVALAFSPQGNELTGIVRTDRGQELRQWYFGGRFLLQLTPPWGDGAPSEAVSVSYGTGRVFVGDREGTIVSLRPDGAVETVARNALLHYGDVAVLGDKLAIAGRDRILLMQSEFLTGTAGSGPNAAPLEPVPVSVTSLPNPLRSPVPGRSDPERENRGNGDRSSLGLEFLDSWTLLVWSRGAESPIVGLVDIVSGRFQQLGVELSSPLKQVGGFAQGIIIVDESGECLILDPFSFQTRFRYRSPGMNKLIFAVGDSLVGGRTSLSTFGSPLLQINERTGETVAISDPSLFAYNLIFEPREANLFTVSVDSRDGLGRTLLKVHSGYGFERSRVLFEYSGEDLTAGLTADGSGRVYSSLGFERVVVWDGDSLQRMDDAHHVHRDLYIAGERLIAVNRDGSFSFWDTRTRRHLLDLYVFQDITWLVVLPDGSTYSPED
jgi:hypothetical protein